MRLHPHLRKAVLRLPQHDLDQVHPGPLQSFGSDLFQQVPRHVLGRGIAGEHEALVSGQVPGKDFRYLLVRLVVHETVIPLFVYPASQPFLEHAEVDDPPDLVQLVGLGVEKDHVVVPVQMGALSLVSQDAVPGAELDAVKK